MNLAKSAIQVVCAPTLVLALLCAGAPVRADDPVWLADAEEGFARVDEKLQNFSVRGNAFEDVKRVGETPQGRKLIRTFQLSRQGNSLKSVQSIVPNSHEKIYAAANDDYFFQIHDKPEGGPRFLDDLGERSGFTLANGRRRKPLSIIFEDSAFVMGGFGFPVERPIDVLRHNAGHLTATEVEEDGRRLLLLEGEFHRFINTQGMSSLEIPHLTDQNSRILLDPQLDYRIVRWESKGTRGGKEYQLIRTFEYKAFVDGYPVLSLFRVFSGSPSIGYGIYETEFTDWQLNVNKPAEFRLPHFGLKEPQWAPRPWFSGWVRLLVIGLALVVGGGWLYRRAASRAK